MEAAWPTQACTYCMCLKYPWQDLNLHCLLNLLRRNKSTDGGVLTIRPHRPTVERALLPKIGLVTQATANASDGGGLAHASLHVLHVSEIPVAGFEPALPPKFV